MNAFVASALLVIMHIVVAHVTLFAQTRHSEQQVVRVAAPILASARSSVILAPALVTFGHSADSSSAQAAYIAHTMRSNSICTTVCTNNVYTDGGFQTTFMIPDGVPSSAPPPHAPTLVLHDLVLHGAEMQGVPNFTSIEIDGAGLLIEITCQQSSPNVQIVGEKSGAPRTITTEVDDGTLYISGTPSSSRVVVKVSVPRLEQLEINGAQVVKVYNLASPELSVEIAGASSLEAFGKVRKLNLDVTGAGMVNLKELAVESLFIECAGAAKAVTTVEKQIHATATGVSKILYYGKPTSVKKESCGLAVIKGMTP
jgi:hypothetical protein